MVDLEKVLQFLVDELSRDINVFKAYGYDVYLPQSMRRYASTVENLDSSRVQARIIILSPIFYNAAWELCRRGVLRPGIREYFAQNTDDGSAGNGYCITPYGIEWLSNTKHLLFVPTEPESFGKLLGQYDSKFGPGFHQRAQEALKCYRANANLATCAMCGAAVESILLSLAIQKEGNEAVVLKMYESSGGRQKILNLLKAQRDAKIQRTLEGINDLLSYWRDDSAHGKSSTISDTEAFTSITLLLRFAQFGNDNWDAITGGPGKT